jgi:5'-nucleotidase/UDP-sugar diphosphatase
LSGFIDAVKFPVLMSNADIGSEPLLSDKIAKSLLIERAVDQLTQRGVDKIIVLSHSGYGVGQRVAANISDRAEGP